MARSIESLPAVQMTTVVDGAVSDLTAQIVAASLQYGPIFRTVFRSGFQPVTMIGPEANKFILQTHRDHFSNAKGWSFGSFFGSGLLNMDEPVWSVHRRLLNPAFTMAYIAHSLPSMDGIFTDVSSDWTERNSIDLYAETRRITFQVVANVLAGYRSGPEVDRLHQLFNARIHEYAASKESWAHFRHRMRPVEAELNRMLLARIQQKRVSPGDDVISLLTSSCDESGKPLSDEQILGHFKILLVAGHETTSSLAAWVLYLLATHSKYRWRVQRELAYVLAESGSRLTLDAIKQMHVLANAIDEAGRLYSPVVNVPRGVIKEFEFGGYSIPPETLVRCSIAAGHHLPIVFDNPDTFDPDRFEPPREEQKRHPYALVIFGGGPRTCIGVNLAQIEIKALVTHVLSAYELESVAATPAIQDNRGIVGRPYPGLYVRVKRRS